jgi:peroxiredoxin Q/BCP
MAQLQVGDKAPAFTLVDQDGEKVKLSAYKGRNVVVYFYPRANTPGCTTQSCALRDAEPDLAELDADVIGISPDAPKAQKKFDDKYELGFPLLADEDHAVAEAWGAWGEKSMYGKKFKGIVRSAFVVDPKGKIAGAFYKVSPKATVGAVVASLEELAAN